MPSGWRVMGLSVETREDAHYALDVAWESPECLPIVGGAEGSCARSAIAPLKFRRGYERGAKVPDGLETRVDTGSLAEKAGFEPAEGFTPRTLSRRVT